MQVSKGTWRMREQCVPGSLSSSPAQEPGNKAILVCGRSCEIDVSTLLHMHTHTHTHMLTGVLSRQNLRLKFFVRRMRECKSKYNTHDWDQWVSL